MISFEINSGPIRLTCLGFMVWLMRLMVWSKTNLPDALGVSFVTNGAIFLSWSIGEVVFWNDCV
jgi:hypothetical protein